MNDKKKELEEAKTETLPAITDQQAAVLSPEANLLFDGGKFAALERIADIMSSGSCTVPQHLRGNRGDCFAVCMQSAMWGMNPYAVAQKTHIVKGTLGYEAQLVNAVINTMAPCKDRIHYEWYGPWERVIGKFKIIKGANGEYQAPAWSPADEEGCGVKVWATLKGEDEPRVLPLLLSQATVRNSTLWASDPKQQLAYLAVKRWSRLYCPEVILGVYTPDELDEEPMKNITPAKEVKGGASIADLKAQLGLQTANEVSKTAEVVPPLSEIVQAEITASRAPVTIQDIADYLAFKKITTPLDEMESNPKLTKWSDFIRNKTPDFIKAAAEWVTAKA
jgi:hypothetical protein